MVGVLAAAILVCQHQAAQRHRDALFGRDRLGQSGIPDGDVSALAVASTRGLARLGVAGIDDHVGAARRRAIFSLGRWGLPVNAIAVVWGLFVVINISWPRTAIYGTDPWGRFAAPLATLALIAAGAAYYLLYQRKRTGIVPRHAARAKALTGRVTESKNPTIESRWIEPGSHPANERQGDHESQRIRPAKDRPTIGDPGQASGAEAAEAAPVPGSAVPRAVRALPGLVRSRLHRTGPGGGRADRRAFGRRRRQLVSLVVSC